MIRTLRGTLLEKRPDAVVVEAGGVGYALAVPLTTSEVLPAPPAEVFLHTHFRVREDAHELFGFATAEARDLFERMLRIHRLPARSALSVLSHLSPEAFRAAVAAGDIATLTAIPGIGRKIAEKIVLELREAFATEPPPGARAEENEVLAALAALGYRPDEARRALDAARREAAATADTAALLRLALTALARKDGRR